MVVDTSAFERSLFSSGHRGTMVDTKTNKPRTPGSTLSLEALLRSLSTTPIPCQLHNSGNDALMCLFAFQKLLDPDNTPLPTPKARIGRPGAALGLTNTNSRMSAVMPPVPHSGYGKLVPLTPGCGEFGQVRRSSTLQPYASASTDARLKSTIEKDGRSNGMPVVTAYR